MEPRIRLGRAEVHIAAYEWTDEQALLLRDHPAAVDGQQDAVDVVS
jgi:hypothetical protein